MTVGSRKNIPKIASAGTANHKEYVFFWSKTVTSSPSGAVHPGSLLQKSAGSFFNPAPVHKTQTHTRSTGVFIRPTLHAKHSVAGICLSFIGGVRQPYAVYCAHS